MNAQERKNAMILNYKGVSKYRNKRVWINGNLFQSEAEANRYKELLDWEKEEIISNLKIQVKFELQPKYRIGLKSIRAISYIADFTYNENGKFIVEDFKGFRTEVYKLKKKMFEYKYGIEIRETGRRKKDKYES